MAVISFIVRKYKSSEKVELTFEGVECLPVESLRESASSKLGIPLNDLSTLQNQPFDPGVEFVFLPPQGWCLVVVF